MSTPISRSPRSRYRVRECTAANLMKLCESAYAAHAASIPVCLMPPPKSFLNRLAFIMNSSVPTRQDPIGAPGNTAVSSWWKRSTVQLPRPLLKHRLTESNGSHSSFTGVAVSTTTCQMRAPSRCILIPLAWANSEMAAISVWGMIAPSKVFSMAMSSVGAL